MDYLFDDELDISNEGVSTVSNETLIGTEANEAYALVVDSVAEVAKEESKTISGVFAIESIDSFADYVESQTGEDKGGLSPNSVTPLQIGIEAIATNINYPKEKLPKLEAKDFEDVNDREKASLEALGDIKAFGTKVLNAIRTAIKSLFSKISVTINNMLTNGDKQSKVAEGMMAAISEGGGLDKLKSDSSELTKKSLVESFKDGGDAVAQLKSLDKIISKVPKLVESADDLASDLDDKKTLKKISDWSGEVTDTFKASKVKSSGPGITLSTRSYAGKSIVMTVGVDGSAFKVGVQSTPLKDNKLNPATTNSIDDILKHVAKADFSNAKETNAKMLSVQKKIDKVLGDAIADIRKSDDADGKEKLKVAKRTASIVTKALPGITVKTLSLYSKLIKRSMKYAGESVKQYEVGKNTIKKTTELLTKDLTA